MWKYMWNCIEIIYDFLQLYKKLIIEKMLQNSMTDILTSHMQRIICDMFQAGENLAMKSGGPRLH